MKSKKQVTQLLAACRCCWCLGFSGFLSTVMRALWVLPECAVISEGEERGIQVAGGGMFMRSSEKIQRSASQTL